MTARPSIEAMAPTRSSVPDVVLDLDQPARPAASPPPRMSRRRALGLLATVVGGAATIRQFGPAPVRQVGYVAPIPAERVPWGSFAGLVEGADLYLVVVIDTEGAAVAHASDGVSEALWLTGRSNGLTLRLHNGPGHQGASLAATMSAARTSAAATGVLSVRGAAYSFELSRTGPGGGLFAASAVVAGVPHRATWIALDSRRQRGVLTVGDRALAAPPLPAERATVRIGTVTLDPVRLDRLTTKWGRLQTVALHAAGSP
jgi:hypothetical protein